jgi:hypothetical protein
MMTSDIEELLREGIDRLTAGASAPAGLVERARQSNRRRVMIRSAVAAGTVVAAVAAAVTVTLATGGRGPVGAPVRAQTISVVASRTERALAAAADQGTAILETQASGRGVTFGLTALNMNYTFETNPPGSAVVPGVLKSVTAQRLVSWTYRGLYLQEGYSATGRLVFHNTNNEVTLHSGRQVLEQSGAAYPARTRWRTVVRGLQGPLPALTCQDDVVPTAYPSWRATISKALSCGLFSLGGQQRVGGAEALTLISKPQPGLDFRETIWMDPSTYLPVRLSVTFLHRHARSSQLVYDFRWLEPTKANLAALQAAIRQATIPAGYRTLPANYLLLPGVTRT